MNKKEEIEQALQEAKEAGIVDIDAHPGHINIETIKLATKLTKKHMPRIMKEIEERRKNQQ